MEITGRMIHKGPIESVQTKKGELVKQIFVIQTEGQHPKKVCMVMWNNTVSDMSYEIGDLLKCSIDIESREFNGRWYTDIKAWKVLPAEGSLPQGSRISQRANESPNPMDDSSLPF